MPAKIENIFGDCDHAVEPPAVSLVDTKSKEQDNILEDYTHSVVFLPATQIQRGELMPVQEVRETLKKEIQSNDSIVVDTTPGSGKTFSVTEFITNESQNNRRILYAAPSKTKADETLADLSHINNVIRYRSRDKDNCDRYIDCKKAMTLGRSPFETVCKKKCGKISKDKRCAYLSQLDNYHDGIIVCTHAAAPYVIEKVETQFDVIIVDECPTESIITSDAISTNNSVLLKMGMERTAFWKKISKATFKTIPRLIENSYEPAKYLQLPAGIDEQFIQEMSNGAAWRGLEQHQAELDKEAHEKACARAEEDARGYNKDLDKRNKTRFKQYKKEKEQYLASAKSEGGLISPFREFEPLKPRGATYPEMKLSPLPANQKDWEDDWEATWARRKWMPIEDAQPLRDIGITAEDIAEALLRLSDIELLYIDDDPGLEHVDESEFKFFRAALSGEINSKVQAYIEVKEVINVKNEITISTFLKIVDFRQWNTNDSRVIILDGTAHKKELEAVFGKEIRVVQADAILEESYKVHLVQSIGIRKAKDLAEEAKENDANIRKYVRRAIKHLHEDDNKVLLLTHKSIEKQVLAIAQSIKPKIEWDITYYGKERGVNTYEECNAVIVIGTPYASPIEFGPISTALFGHVDMKWIAGKGMRELVQCIHRIRPINHKTTIIVMGREFPVGAFGKPELTIDYMRNGGQNEKNEIAAEFLSEIAENIGCMNKKIAHYYGILDESEVGKETKAIATYTKGDWSVVLDLVIESTGMEKMKYRQKGKRGRPASCAGTKEAFRGWYLKQHWAFLSEEWTTH